MPRTAFVLTGKSAVAIGERFKRVSKQLVKQNEFTQESRDLVALTPGGSCHAFSRRTRSPVDTLDILGIEHSALPVEDFRYMTDELQEGAVLTRRGRHCTAQFSSIVRPDGHLQSVQSLHDGYIAVRAAQVHELECEKAGADVRFSSLRARRFR